MIWAMFLQVFYFIDKIIFQLAIHLDIKCFLLLKRKKPMSSFQQKYNSIIYDREKCTYQNSLFWWVQF